MMIISNVSDVAECNKIRIINISLITALQYIALAKNIDCTVLMHDAYSYQFSMNRLNTHREYLYVWFRRVLSRATSIQFFTL
jgi:hypothetical protein